MASVSNEEKKQVILDSIRGIPDFPKPGILFWDVTTILLNPIAFKYTIELFVERYKDMKIDCVAGFEARGLIFGAPLALELGCAFVPLRKPGKLPVDKIEMHEGAIQPGQRVLLVDDLIATGGTLNAGVNLVKKAGGIPIEAAMVIELPFLNGRSKVQGTELFVLVEKEGA
eukprot:gene14282-20258_t